MAEGVPPGLAAGRRESGYRDLVFFLRFVRPVWRLGAASLLLGLLSGGLAALVPLSGKALVDYVVLGQDPEGLARVLATLGLESLFPAASRVLSSVDLLVVLLAAGGLFIAAVEIVQRYLNVKFEQELTFNLQTGLFDHLLRFPLSFFRRSQTGYLVSRVSGDVAVVHAIFSQGLLEVVKDAFRLAVGATVIFWLNWKIALAALVALPLHFLVSLLFSGRMRRVSREEKERSSQVDRHVQEVLSGVEVVKSFTGEEREVERVSGAVRDLVRARVRSSLLAFTSTYAVRGAQFAFTLLVMWLGVREIRSGGMTIGDYVAFTAYVVYLTGAVRGLSLFHLLLQPLMASVDRLMEMFETVPELAPGEEAGAGLRPERVRGEIRFENVGFRYGEGRFALGGVSFAVMPGEVLALAGPSGSGKTTLVNLLLKFFVPESGALKLDGTEVGQLDTRWLRSRIGVVSQEVFLFDDTVENNIRYGRPGAGREQVEEAARRAMIHREILGFPGGYSTVVGERGVLLSAGQRQRISIARAFLKDPPILVFDEPTSALDAESERLVRSSLEELVRDRTTIVISHREQVTGIADVVVTLENGRVAHIRRGGKPLQSREGDRQGTCGP